VSRTLAISAESAYRFPSGVQKSVNRETFASAEHGPLDPGPHHAHLYFNKEWAAPHLTEGNGDIGA